ncbi:MAG: hypothetical protein ACREJX_20385, partial [Polyangiaceae bacterium]
MPVSIVKRVSPAGTGTSAPTPLPLEDGAAEAAAEVADDGDAGGVSFFFVLSSHAATLQRTPTQMH